MIEKIIYSLVTCIILIIVLFILIKKKNNIHFLEKFKIIKLRTLLLFNKSEDARKYALKLTQKYPKSYVIHKTLGELYEKQGKFNIALDEYIRTVELNNKDFETHYKVAFLLEKTDKKEEAIIMLHDLLKEKPDYLEATQLLGNILYDEERFKEAISVYADALKYHPTEYDLYYNMGIVFTRLNDFQKAKKYYEKAAQLNTYLYNGQYNLALISMIQGELEEAEKYFTSSLQDEELEAMAYFYLAQIALIKGENENGLNYINLALELNKKIEEKISNHPLFIPIQDKIKIPNETRKIKIKLSKKERKTNKYLEEMYSLVESLNGGKSALFEEKNIDNVQELENNQEKERE